MNKETEPFRRNAHLKIVCLLRLLLAWEKAPYGQRFSTSVSPLAGRYEACWHARRQEICACVRDLALKTRVSETGKPLPDSSQIFLRTERRASCSTNEGLVAGEDAFRSCGGVFGILTDSKWGFFFFGIDLYGNYPFKVSYSNLNPSFQTVLEKSLNASISFFR